MSILGMSGRKKRKNAMSDLDTEIQRALAGQVDEKEVVVEAPPVAPPTTGKAFLAKTKARTDADADWMKTSTSPSSPLFNEHTMAEAIKTVESGGNYEAQGESGEYGAYQIMPGTWKDWAGDLEPTPENQDKVATQKLGEWIKKGLTPTEIAAKWNSGSSKNWTEKRGTNKFGVDYDVPGYVNKVVTALDSQTQPEDVTEVPRFDSTPEDVSQVQVPETPAFTGTTGEWGDESELAQEMRADVDPTPALNEKSRLGGQLFEGTKDFVRNTIKGAAVLAKSEPMYYTKEEQAIIDDMKKTGHMKPLPNEGVLGNYLHTAADITALKADPELQKDQTFMEKLTRTAPQVLGQALTSVVTGGTLSMPLMGLQIVGSSYTNALAGGATERDATNMALLNAIIQAPLEQIGIGKATKWFKPKMNIIKKVKQIAEAGMVEGLTEFIQQYPDAWTNLMATKPDGKALTQLGKVLNSKKVFAEALESGAIGTILGGGVQTVMAQGTPVKKEVAVKPEVKGAALDEVGEAAAAFEAEQNEAEKAQGILRDKGFSQEFIDGMRPQDIKATIDFDKVEKPKPIEGSIPVEKPKAKTKPVAKPVKKAEAKPIKDIPKPPTKEFVEPEATEEVLEEGTKLQDMRNMSIEELAKLEASPNLNPGVKSIAKNMREAKVAELKKEEAQKPKKFVPAKDETVEPGNAIIKAEGKVYGPAPSHLQVLDTMPENVKLDDAVEGFRTTKGNDITREQASDLMGKKDLQSEDLVKKPMPIKDTKSYKSEEIEKTIVEEMEKNPEDVQEVKEVTVSPEQYLDLTTGTDKVKNMVKRNAVDPKKPALTTDQAIVLEVNKDGKVVNHDGRHRSAKIGIEGGTEVPVVLVPEDPSVDLNKIKALHSQKFGKTDRGTTVSLTAETKKVVKTKTGKKVTPKVTKIKAPTRKHRLPLTATKGHKKFKEVEELTTKQRENEEKKLKEYEDNPFIVARMKRHAELKEMRKAKQTPEGVTDKAKLQETRHAALRKAIEDGTLTQEQRDRVTNLIYNTKTGQPKATLLGDAQRAAETSPIKIEPEDIVQGTYELAMYYAATGTEPTTRTAVKGLMRKYLEENALITAPASVIRKGGAKPLRAGSEGALDSAVLEDLESVEGVKQTGKKAIQEADIDDIRAEGTEAIEEYATEEPGLPDQTEKVTDEATEGSILAEQASIDLNMDVTYDGNGVYRINNGAHEGTTFKVDVKEPVASDVMKAGEAHMSAREETAKDKGTIPTPVKPKVILRKKKKDKVEAPKEDVAKDLDDEFGSDVLEGREGEMGGIRTDAIKNITKALRKFAGKFQIQANINRKGEENLAQAAVAHNSNIKAHTERELRTAKKIEQLTRDTLGDMNEKELTEVVVAYENKDVYNALPEKTQKKYKPMIDALTEYFEGERQRLKNITGQDLNYVLRSLEDAKKRLLKAETTEEIEQASNDIDMFRQMQFAPIPVALFRTMMDRKMRSANPKTRKEARKTIKFMHEMSKKRKVKSLKMLLEKANEKSMKLTITPTQLVGMYGARAAKDYALQDFVKEMEKIDLVRKWEKGTEVPAGFKKVSNQKYPSLSRYVVSPRGLNILDNLVESDLQANAYDRINSITKLLQFFNPFIMAYNDALQGIASGAYVGKSTTKMPAIAKKAFKSVRAKDDLYLELQGHGLYSRPLEFSNRDIMDQLDEMSSFTSNTFLHGRASRAARVKGKSINPLAKELAYLNELTMGSAHMAAWSMDEYLRTVTAMAYMAKGHTAKEAAKLGAAFHGDYASVPKGTRKWLNRFFFTPTFKIVMMGTAVKMYTDSAKAVKQYATGKGKDVTKMQKAMLTALITRNIVEASAHMILTSMGYGLEDDDWMNYGTRYKNKDTGETLVIPSPFNIGRRILGKVKKNIIDRGEGNISGMALYKALQGDLAIMPKIAYETLISGKRWDGTPIYNEFDSPTAKKIKQVAYATGRVIAVGAALERELSSGETIDSDYNLRVKKQEAELNRVQKALKSIAPIYMGPPNPQTLRLSKSIKFLQNKFKSELRKAAKQGKLTDEMKEKWEKQYLKRIDELMIKFEDAQAKERGTTKGGTSLERRLEKFK